MNAVVYFIQEGNDGPVKIGRTQPGHLWVRLSQLQCGNPRRLRVRGWMACPPEEETALHHRLAAHSLHGEWFRPHPDVLREAAAGERHHAHTQRAQRQRATVARERAVALARGGAG